MSNSQEVVTFTTPEYVSLYGIPPLKTKARGYYSADDWNLKKRLWHGNLKVVVIDDEDSLPRCEIRLVDLDTDEIFAICPYTSTKGCIDQTRDSSRDFVMKFVGSHSYILLGVKFQDKGTVLKFLDSLQEYISQRDALESIRKNKSSIDFSLKEGQRIHIPVKSEITHIHNHKNEETSITQPQKIPPPLIPPPVSLDVEMKEAVQSDSDEDFDDDFGDFVS